MIQQQTSKESCSLEIERATVAHFESVSNYLLIDAVVKNFKEIQQGT